MRVHKDRLSTQIYFSSGLSFGFSWVHCNGESSKSCAMLASYHPPNSITWRWAVYWLKPKAGRYKPRFRTYRKPGNYKLMSMYIYIPLFGGIELAIQPLMLRQPTAVADPHG